MGERDADLKGPDEEWCIFSGLEKTLLQNQCDRAMVSYESGQRYKKEQDDILEQIQSVKLSMGAQQRKMLVELIDKISRSDSGYAYHAFYEGILWGLYLAQK